MSEITIAIQIGNSDDKLSQSQWAEYVNKCRMLIERFCSIVHFFGASENYKPWQNVCWVFNCEMHYALILKDALIEVRKEFNQDSIAWSECKVEFI